MRMSLKSIFFNHFLFDVRNFYRPVRTSGLAVSAADAVHAVGIFPNRNIELADFLTGTAFRAFLGVDFKSIERNFVEYAVNCS